LTEWPGGKESTMSDEPQADMQDVSAGKAKARKPEPKRKTRIVIVDDHPIVRKGLAEMIDEEDDLEVCGEAGDVVEALKVFDTVFPELMIIDISLNGGNGLDLVKQIRSRDNQVKMLVWSMHDESLYAERALHAGAKGFVNKQEPTDTILGAIRRVVDGKVYLSSRMTDRMLRRAVGGDDDVEQNPIEALTDRELEVFEMIGRGMTTREIAEKLHLSIKTIETHRENIKAKLNLDNSARLGRYAAQWVIEDS
jgi:DNA-binding NarL/FixJ family response regulator